MFTRTQPKSNGTCVLVGDDAAFLAEATALAKQELGCKVFQGGKKYPMPAHTQWKFNSLPLDDRCAATLNLFTDLELLAHTDYFVGALLHVLKRIVVPYLHWIYLHSEDVGALLAHFQSIYHYQSQAYIGL